MEILCLKNVWRDKSVVKSTGCSLGRSWFDSRSPYRCSQPPVTPVSGDLMPSYGPHTCRRKIIKEMFKTILFLKLGVMVHTFNPNTQETKQPITGWGNMEVRIQDRSMYPGKGATSSLGMHGGEMSILPAKSACESSP